MNDSKPRKAVVYGMKYDVRWVPDEHPGLCDYSGQPCNGMHDPQEYTIHVSETLNLQVAQVILAHELGHAIEDHFGLSLKDNVVDAMARGWVYIIQNNPSLIRFLQRKTDPAKPSEAKP